MGFGMSLFVLFVYAGMMATEDILELQPIGGYYLVHSPGFIAQYIKTEADFSPDVFMWFKTIKELNGVRVNGRGGEKAILIGQLSGFLCVPVRGPRTAPLPENIILFLSDHVNVASWYLVKMKNWEVGKFSQKAKQQKNAKS
ncbi:unnamed protein product [Lota lota]